MSELSTQAEHVDEQLGELLARIEEQATPPESEEEEAFLPEETEENKAAAADRARIETLFQLATGDRSKAFELKQELDRLGLFKEYEDRFLDLFKKMD